MGADYPAGDPGIAELPDVSRRILLLHGYEGSGPEHWQSWLFERLRARGEEVAYPQFPDPDRPRLDEWLPVLDVELERAGRDELVVLAHSAGCNLWLHRAARGLHEPADRVLLVAPPGPSWREPSVVGFMPVPLDATGAAEAARTTRIVASTDDPYCSADDARAYAAALGVELDLIPNAGHLNTVAGYGPWPAVEEWALNETIPMTGAGQV
jgi:predicted alpha/beta hydrolase family esterase